MANPVIQSYHIWRADAQIFKSTKGSNHRKITRTQNRGSRWYKKLNTTGVLMLPHLKDVKFKSHTVKNHFFHSQHAKCLEQSTLEPPVIEENIKHVTDLSEIYSEYFHSKYILEQSEVNTYTHTQVCTLEKSNKKKLCTKKPTIQRLREKQTSLTANLLNWIQHRVYILRVELG